MSGARQKPALSTLVPEWDKEPTDSILYHCYQALKNLEAHGTQTEAEKEALLSVKDYYYGIERAQTNNMRPLRAKRMLDGKLQKAGYSEGIVITLQWLAETTPMVTSTAVLQKKEASSGAASAVSSPAAASPPPAASVSPAAASAAVVPKAASSTPHRPSLFNGSSNNNGNGHHHAAPAPAVAAAAAAVAEVKEQENSRVAIMKLSAIFEEKVGNYKAKEEYKRDGIERIRGRLQQESDVMVRSILSDMHECSMAFQQNQEQEKESAGFFSGLFIKSDSALSSLFDGVVATFQKTPYYTQDEEKRRKLACIIAQKMGNFHSQNAAISGAIETITDLVQQAPSMVLLGCVQHTRNWCVTYKSRLSARDDQGKAEAEQLVDQVTQILTDVMTDFFRGAQLLDAEKKIDYLKLYNEYVLQIHTKTNPADYGKFLSESGRHATAAAGGGGGAPTVRGRG